MDGLTVPIRFGGVIQSQRVDGATASRAAENDVVIHTQFGTDSVLRCKFWLVKKEIRILIGEEGGVRGGALTFANAS